MLDGYLEMGNFTTEMVISLEEMLVEASSSWDLQRAPRKSRIQTTNEAMNHQSLLKMEKLDEISSSGHMSLE